MSQQTGEPPQRAGMATTIAVGIGVAAAAFFVSKLRLREGTLSNGRRRVVQGLSLFAKIVPVLEPLDAWPSLTTRVALSRE